MILVDTNDKNIFILIIRSYLDESLRQVATSVKIPFFGNKKLQPYPFKITYISSFELVRVSECHKKKQEVGFDLLCRLVPGAGLEPAQP